MPFTPLHLGPGFLLKSLMPRMSLRAFAVAQVVIDTEVLIHLALGHSRVHDVLHRLDVATAVGLGSAFVTWAAMRAAAGRLEGSVAEAMTAPLPFRSALAGGIAGGASHALLDATMHADQLPFLPLTTDNPLLMPHGMVVVSLLCGLMLALGPIVLQRLGVAPFDRIPARF